MQIISDLSDMIEEEVSDADKYIKCASSKKEEYPELANTFYKLSVEELGHAMALHEQVTALIAAYRKEHGEPPEKMMWVYDYLHKKHINKLNGVKALQGSFKETK